MNIRFEIIKPGKITEPFTGPMSISQAHIWEIRWRKFWEARGYKFKRIETKHSL